MSADGKTAIQLYYWKVEFEDHTTLAQFDDFGNEILIKSICPEQYFYTDPVRQQKIIRANAPVFESFEKLHGRVTRIGWYPYTNELAEKATKKNNTLRIATNEDLTPLELIVPRDYYVGAPQNVSKIEFAIKPQVKSTVMVPMESLQYQLGISLYSYSEHLVPITKKWLVQYK